MGCGGQHHWNLKRPWEMLDYCQPSRADHWQDNRHQRKRLYLPGSFGDIHIQMQMTSAIPPLLSNAASQPPSIVESINFSSQHMMPDFLSGNDGSAASALNLQLPYDSQGFFLQPAPSFPPLSGTVSNSKELWAFTRSLRQLVRLTDI